MRYFWVCVLESTTSIGVRQLMAANSESTVQEIEPIVKKGISDAFMGLVSGFPYRVHRC